MLKKNIKLREISARIFLRKLIKKNVIKLIDTLFNIIILYDFRMKKILKITKNLVL
jgi:hypothetical protein